MDPFLLKAGAYELTIARSTELGAMVFVFHSVVILSELLKTHVVSSFASICSKKRKQKEQHNKSRTEIFSDTLTLD